MIGSSENVPFRIIGLHFGSMSSGSDWVPLGHGNLSKALCAKSMA